MAEVMNRAARRAAGMVKVDVKVSHRIDVVPMPHVETYFTHEIASEGPWRSDVPVFVAQPEAERGWAGSGWFPRTLAQMREARERHGPTPLEIDLDGEYVIKTDVGLIDVVVFFEVPTKKLPTLLRSKTEGDKFFVENARHLDSVCGNALHDQMVLANALHLHHSNGSLLLHFHNLIFGLRKEIRDGHEIIGPLDTEPLLKVLATGRRLNFIGGRKP